MSIKTLRSNWGASVEDIGNTSVLKAESKEQFQAMEEYVLRKGLSIRDKANSVTF